MFMKLDVLIFHRKAIEKACQPVRQVKQITNVQNSFKPVNDHVMNVSMHIGINICYIMNFLLVLQCDV